MAAILATAEQGGVRTGALVAPAANNISFSCRWYWDGTTPPAGEYFTIHVRRNAAYTSWHWLGFNELGRIELNAGSGGAEVFSISANVLTVPGWYSVGYTYNTATHLHSLYFGISTFAYVTTVSNITGLAFDTDEIGTDQSGIWFASQMGNTRQWSVLGGLGEAVLTGSELLREANAASAQRTTHLWSDNPLISNLLDISVPSVTAAATFNASLEGLERTTVLAANSDYTRSMWVQVNASTPAGGQIFFYRGDDPQVSYVDYVVLKQLAGGTLRLETTGGTASGSVLTAGFHCLQYTYTQSTGTHRVYLNGSLAITHVDSVNALTFTHEYVGTDTYTVAWAAGAAKYLRIWNAVLSDPELTLEYTYALVQRTTNLWLNTPLQADLLDISGNGRNWTGLGTISFTTPASGGPAYHGRNYIAVDGPITFSGANPPSNRYYPLALAPRTRIDEPTKGSWNAPNSFSIAPWSSVQWTWRALPDRTSQVVGPLSTFQFNATADYDWQFMRWQFGPFDAFTINAVVDFCALVRVMFQNGGAGQFASSDARIKLHVYIGIGETAQVRTILLDNYVDGTSLRQNTNPWWQSLTTPQQLGPATVVDGDCLILEMGFRVVSSPATLPATYPPSFYTEIKARLSGANSAVSDGIPGSTDQSLSPWFQFSQTFPLKAGSSPPANDDCADAIPITLTTTTPYSSSGIDTTGSLATSRGVFFSWTAPTSGRVFFSAFRSNYNVLIDVFHDCTQTTGPSNFVNYERLATHRSQAIATFEAVSGQAYLIRLRSLTSTICGANSGGIAYLQGFYQDTLVEDDLLLPAGPLMVLREGQPVSTSFAFADAAPTGIALDYTHRPLVPLGGGPDNVTDRVLLGLFSFELVEILDPYVFGSGDEELDFIGDPWSVTGIDIHPAQSYVTAAGMLHQAWFGNGFLLVSGQGTLPSFMNGVSSNSAYSAFKSIDAIDGDNQPGAPFSDLVQAPAIEVTAPWAITVDEVNGIAYYTSGSLYIPVGGQQIRRYDLTNSVDLGVWVTLPTRSSRVPSVRGLQYLGGGEVLVCNGDLIYRLNSAGGVSKTYVPSIPLESQQLVDVKLTADGTKFWVVDLNTARLFKFDLETGTELLTVPTYLVPGSLVQMAIYQPEGHVVPPPPPLIHGCPIFLPIAAGSGQACLMNDLLTAAIFLPAPNPIPAPEEPPPVVPPPPDPPPPPPDDPPDPEPTPPPPDPTPAPTPDPEPPVPDPVPPPTPPPIPEPQPDPDPGVVTSADMTYLGAYRLPQQVGAFETYYAAGLAVRHEPTDTGNEIHLLSTLGISQNGVDESSQLIEWRDQPGLSPSPIWDIASYPTPATIVKQYGNLFGSGPTAKRRSDSTYPGAGDTSIAAFLDGGQGCFIDPINPSRLWVNWSEGYYSGAADWCMCFIDLVYSNTTGTAQGPYKIQGNGGKALGGGFAAVPTGFASAYLSGKRLVTGFGGYRARTSVGDPSLGPALLAIDPFNGVTPETTVPAQSLVYHQADVHNLQRSSYLYGPAFVGGGTRTQWSWMDNVHGGAWVHGSERAGMILATSQVEGMMNYTAASDITALAGQYIKHKWRFYSETQIAQAAQSLVSPYGLIPLTQDFSLRTLAPYPQSNVIVDAPIVVASVKAITSNPAFLHGDPLNGAVIETVNPHGLTAEVQVCVIGTEQPNSYDAIWNAQVIDATHLRIYNTASTLPWTGLAAGKVGSIYRAGKNQGLIAGLAVDPSTNILHLLVRHWQGTTSTSCCFVEKYQLNLGVVSTGATYYVSLTGNDLNVGSLASPKRYISTGLAMLLPGDTLRIRGGTYTAAQDVIDSESYPVPSGTSWASPINVGGYFGETVVMRPQDGQQAIRLTTTTPHYLIFQDLILDGATQTQVPAAGGPDLVYLSSGAHHNRFLRLEVKNNAANGFQLSQNGGSADFNEILSCKIYGNGRTNDTNTGYGIYLLSSGNLIQGNEIYSNNGYGIHHNPGPGVGGNNNIINANRLYLNATHGVNTGNGTTSSAILIARGSNNLVSNNLVYTNQAGISVYSNATGTLVVFNTVVGNTNEGIWLQYYTGPPIIRNNIAYQNGTNYIDYGGTGTPIQDHNLFGVNPLFMDQAGGNFNLLSGSPAGGAGVAVAEVPADYAGTTRPPAGPYDIGAYVYAIPANVDCVLSAWSMQSAGPWGPCLVNGTQTRSETWVRTIVTPPSGAGAPCGPTSEIRIGTQACTYVPPITPPPGSNAYFDALIALPGFWKGYSLRPVVGQPITSPYYEKQFDYPNVGGYQNSNSVPKFVTYDAGVNAAKMVIPPFAEANTLAQPVSISDTRIFPVGMASQFVVGAQLKLDSEIMIITVRDPSGTVPRGLTVQRAQYGTAAATHAAAAVINSANNSLPNQMRFPLSTADGNTYVFTWDAYFTSSFLGTGLAGNKSFQLTSGGDTIWLEVKTNMQGGNSFTTPPGFNPAIHVAGIDVRAYLTVGGDANWLLTNGSAMGPGPTNNTPIVPINQTFIIWPNRWTRYWVEIVQRVNDYDTFNLWVADEQQDPVRVYADVPMSVRPPDFSIFKFWIEFNDSQARLPTGRTNDFRDLVAYVKNIAAMRNMGALSQILVKPVA